MKLGCQKISLFIATGPKGLNAASLFLQTLFFSVFEGGQLLYGKAKFSHREPVVRENEMFQIRECRKKKESGHCGEGAFTYQTT